MTESATPICDLIRDLTAGGMSLDLSLATAMKIEAALSAIARSRVSTPENRDKWRVKKAAQRASKVGQSPGTNPDPISTKTQEVLSKKVSTDPRCPDVPGDNLFPSDDWPADYAEQFWKTFPPFRRQARAKVDAKLARIRAGTGKKKVTWEKLFGGVLKFVATNPGNYAPAPMVWLNDGRWDREYGSQQGGSNEANRSGGAGGKVGFAGVAARLRAARDGELPPDEPAGDPRR